MRTQAANRSKETRGFEQMQQPARKQMNREFENKELTARKGLKNFRARSKLLERNWLAKGRDPLRAGRAAKDRELMARKPAKQGRAKGREPAKGPMHAKGRELVKGRGPPRPGSP